MRPQSFRSTFFIVFAIIGTLISLQAQASTVPRAPQIDARGYLLMDAASGNIIVEHNADQRLPPASLTKMMTAYIAEAELQKGNISEQDMAPISVQAWKMGGSRMFVREGTRVSVGDLLRGIIIQSGNDASVAMAEFIAGSEDAFADLMNQHARRLGMNDSHFVNSTGWPAENHYTTARDMAILARAITRDFPEHYDIYAEKEYTYNGITQHNRNKLLWRDNTVDGLKTGHTEEAGYCLSASAKRDGMRLIAVVLGTASENARAQEIQKMFNFGFRFFETHQLYAADEAITQTKVWKGQTDQLNLGLAQPLSITVPRGRYKDLQASTNIQQPVVAPVAKGTELGEVEIRLGDEVVATRKLVAVEEVEKGSWWRRILDSLLMLIWG